MIKRIGWIDFLRGLSMIFILLFHTEVYYKEYDYTPYYIYTTNAIILFYFLSGYLFYHEGLFNIKHKLKAIIRSLLIPYFIFTSLIAIPKLLIRQEAINLQEIIFTILTGQASWFITALIVGETFFSIILWISRGKHSWLLITAVLCFITYYIIPFYEHNYWRWQDALLAFDFLYLGYVYHQYEDYFHIINKRLYSLFLLLILFFIKIYEYHIDLTMRNIAVENVPLFIADAFIWLLFIISVIRYIYHCKIIEWTGRNSIIYYFLCGGCPLLVSIIMNRIGVPYNGYVYRYLLAFLLVYAFATALTWLINRYVPFLTGKI